MAHRISRATAFILLTLLAACGGTDSSPGPSAPASGTGTSPTAPAPTPAPSPAPAPAPAPAAPAPAIAALSVHGAPPAGGTMVLVAGTGFQAGVQVSFGGGAATAVTLVPGAGGLTCVTPPNAIGLYDVVVTNPDGQSAVFHGFHYGPPPVPAAFGPAAVHAGDTLTVDGAGFSAAEGLEVLVGGTIATVLSKTATQVVVAAPKMNPGLYQISVVNFDGQYGVAPGAVSYPGP